MTYTYKFSWTEHHEYKIKAGSQAEAEQKFKEAHENGFQKDTFSGYDGQNFMVENLSDERPMPEPMILDIWE